MAAQRPRYRIADLAATLNGRVQGDDTLEIDGVNTLDDAGPHDITLITNNYYVLRWPESGAAAAIVSEAIDLSRVPSDERPLIFVKDAQLATVTMLELMRPEVPHPERGVHPTAWVHEEAMVSPTARLGPHVSVDRGTRVGDEVTLHAGVRLYPGVEIGDGSTLHGNCVIRERCRLGRRVLCYPNVSIGGDGFGFRPAPDGSGVLRVPHIGGVCIGDDVEFGNGSCVDRGKFGDTVIGQGTKFDNLCHIGHNCRIGRHCVIAAGAVFGGSVEMGDGVKIGGSVAFKEHVKIGDEASVGGKSAVMRDVKAGDTVTGYPADLVDRTLRQWFSLRKLPEFMRQTSRQLRDLQ